MYFSTWTRSGKLRIIGLLINVSHTVVTKISFGKGTLPNNILTKDFS